VKAARQPGTLKAAYLYHILKENPLLIEFLSQYGLFLLKWITAIALLLFFFGTLIKLMGEAKAEKSKEILEILKINDEIDETQDLLQEELLPKKEFKRYLKKRKKAQKIRDERDIENLFVIRFEGDLEASDMPSFRECITAVLLIATPADEVLVVLESAGGYVQNYGLAASQLQRIKNKNIPLTAAVDLVAASGGYMMAAVANKIIAAPFAIVGSIGVLAELPNFHRILKQYKIDIEHHTAGQYKTTLSTLAENTDEGRKKFQEELEETHTLFKSHILEHRPAVNIDEIATG